MNSVHSHLLNMNITAHFKYGCDAIPKNVVKQVLPHLKCIFLFLASIQYDNYYV